MSTIYGSMGTPMSISIIRRTTLLVALNVLVCFLSQNDVEAFVVSSRNTHRKRPNQSTVGGVPLSSSLPTQSTTQSLLFPIRRPVSNVDHQKRRSGFPSLMRSSYQRLKQLPRSLKRHRSTTRGSLLFSNLRRSMAIFCAATLIWLGTAGISTAPSHASSAAATSAPPASSQQKISPSAPSSASSGFFSKSLDDMVDDYVKEHMFGDDVYDPVESTYREAIADSSSGEYPKALSEIASTVMGQGGVKTAESTSMSSSTGGGGGGIGGLLSTSVSFLTKRGLSESTAILVLATSFVICGPVMFLWVGMIVGGASKRQMNKVFKSRYGETYR